MTPSPFKGLAPAGLGDQACGDIVPAMSLGVTIGAPRKVVGDVGDRVEADVHGQVVWFESADATLLPSADAYVATVLMLTLHVGVTLEVRAQVSPRLLGGTRAIGELAREWLGVGPPVPVVAVPAGGPPSGGSPAATRPRDGRTALCFTGGVDAFFTLLRGDRPVDVLVYVHGCDIPLGDTWRMEAFERSLRAVAGAVGAHSVVLRTNLLQHPLIMAVTWERSHGGALAAAGHLLVHHAGRLLMSSSFPFAFDYPWGSHWRLDPLWSSERLEVEHVGAELWRSEKLRAIAGEPLVQRHLRVCHENRSTTWLNCSECEKCVRTQVTLAGCGRLDEFTVFDPDEGLVRRVDSLPPLQNGYMVEIYRRLLDGQLEPPLHRAVERLVNRSTAAALAAE